MHNNTKQSNLRKIFVQLLFSLAIGHAAIRIGCLVLVEGDLKNHLYSYFHLFLCVIIITSSWVGWHKSESHHNSDSVESVISLQYLILLTDVLLVIFYFIIVNGAEVDLNSKEILTPSSHVEVFWTTIIFFIYLIWDFLTKIIVFAYKFNPESKTYTSKITYTKFFPKRIWITIGCFGYSLLIFLLMDNESNNNLVCLVDIILIALFLTFRGLKQKLEKEYKVYENQLTPQISTELIDENSNIEFPITVQESKKMQKTRFYITKIVPGSILIISTIIYLLLK